MRLLPSMTRSNSHSKIQLCSRPALRFSNLPRRQQQSRAKSLSLTLLTKQNHPSSQAPAVFYYEPAGWTFPPSSNSMNGVRPVTPVQIQTPGFPLPSDSTLHTSHQPRSIRPINFPRTPTHVHTASAYSGQLPHRQATFTAAYRGQGPDQEFPLP